MNKYAVLVALLVSGATAIGGCGQSGSQLSSSIVPVEQGSDEVVTLYFDGNPQTFSINDLAIALALFLNPNASTEQIQQVATDIFGLSLTEAQITGAGPNPLANFDLNGDGSLGQIEDLGVALGVFLGQSTAAGVDQVCQDVLGFSCDVSPAVSLPGPGATPFPVGEEPIDPILVNNSCTLFDAIIAANTDTATGGCPAGQLGRDRILLTGSVLIPSNPNSASVFALPSVLTPITIDGSGFTVQSSTGETPLEVLPSGNLEVTNIRITGGGNGIRNQGNLIITTGTIITGNSNNGIDNDSSTADLIIDGTGIEIRENGGAGIENNGSVQIRGEVQIRNNRSRGIFNTGNLEVRGSGVVIMNNTILFQTGGGIFNSGVALIADGVQIMNNSAGSDGGGIFNRGSLAVQNNVQILSNTAGATTARIGFGGGIYNFSGSALLDRVAISDNRLVTRDGPTTEAGSGGAIRHEDGTLTINNSCVVDNTDISFENADEMNVDARRNWWGQPTGPGPLGSNSSVSGNVDFSNFLTSPASIPGCG